MAKPGIIVFDNNLPDTPAMLGENNVYTGDNTFSNKIIAPGIKPASDSVTAVQITAADGTTAVINVDTTNGNVGIGDTSPSYKLDVNGVINALGTYRVTNQVFVSYTYGDQLTIGTGYANDKLQLKAGGAAVMTALTTGNIGIGTTSPVNALSVVGNVDISYGNNLYFPSAMGATKAKLFVSDVNGTFKIQSGNSVLTLADSGGSASLKSYSTFVDIGGAYDNGANSYIKFTPAGTERMRIINNGNVGIGTTGPYSRLHVVAGNSLSTGVSFSTSDFAFASTGTIFGFNVGANTGNTYGQINAYTSGGAAYGNLVFQSAGGNVGIGITAPTSKIHGVTTLSAATGDEIAYQLNYTTNKATSGNDTGLLINMTDTASPGTSYLIRGVINGVDKFFVKELAGYAWVQGDYGSFANYIQTSRIYYAPAGVMTGINIQNGTWTNTSGTVVPVTINPTYNQASGTAANTDLLINRTETAVGSGTQLLIDAQVSAVSKFSVNNVGDINIVGALNHDGTTVGFYGTAPTTKPTALTAIDASALNTGDATSDTVIGNMRTRINELESKLQALGLIT